MNSIGCGSAAVTERSDLTAQGFRGSDAGSAASSSTSAVTVSSIVCRFRATSIGFVAFCRLRYRLTHTLTLRDLSEILLLRALTVSLECVRQ
jgi:hypothetical protein